MDIQIREVNREDFDGVFSLFKQLWPDKQLYKEDMFTVYSRGLEGNNDKYICAVYDGKVIGFCAIAFMNSFWQEGRIAYIYAMVVDEVLKGQGIGTRLLNEAYSIAGVQGCKKIELDSGFHREAAHKFYEKNSYVKRAYLFSKDIT
ncbi:GNAT family N-acetyltransferase [Sporomusa malonica]|uniref:Acetyltransferase (GNAT) family protein n=1 Tax=Sporomusa malonica TaxID=112901 RepID=A0A1W1YAL4_9FIRM|nr:GNAT family N-acetyltransferase [Sporomusa malonica]SMC33154.1 Acetyltransferase (GNAT) family protein [Sporomusa malonica]